jgi:hypothetical protein
MAVTPGDQKDSGDGGRLVNTKLIRFTWVMS